VNAELSGHRYLSFRRNTTATVPRSKTAVVGSSVKRLTVEFRAYSRVRYGPLYLGHVTDVPFAPVRIPSPCLRRGRDRS
jgi:hypothetical protein